MKGRRFFLFAVALLALVMVMAFQGQAFCALIEIDFEESQGYSPGNLYGQPTGAANTWGGDDRTNIQVTASEHQEGGQSLMINTGSGSEGTNYLNIGGVPDKFMWKFYWKPEEWCGWTETWLESSDGAHDGPSMFFNGNQSILYRSGGAIYTIATGPYPEDWLAVVLVGDLTDKTFDVYLGGESIPTATDCAFNGNPTGLSYLSFYVPAYGAVGAHYYDTDHIGAVPIPGAVWLLGSGLIGIVAVRRRFKKG